MKLSNIFYGAAPDGEIWTHTGTSDVASLVRTAQYLGVRIQFRFTSAEIAAANAGNEDALLEKLRQYREVLIKYVRDQGLQLVDIFPHDRTSMAAALKESPGGVSLRHSPSSHPDVAWDGTIAVAVRAGANDAERKETGEKFGEACRSAIEEMKKLETLAPR